MELSLTLASSDFLSQPLVEFYIADLNVTHRAFSASWKRKCTICWSIAGAFVMQQHQGHFYISYKTEMGLTPNCADFICDHKEL